MNVPAAHAGKKVLVGGWVGRRFSWSLELFGRRNAVLKGLTL
jgi:hypothetical protein